VEGVDKKTFEVINPSTEEVLVSVAEATEKDVDIAVAAARKAFEGSWQKVTPQERSLLLLRLADIAEKNADLLAAVESLDNGKSITMAKGDVGAVIGCLRYYGGWADKITGKTIDLNPETFAYTRQEPVSCSRTITAPGSLDLQFDRLVSVLKSSHGTSPCSCSPGRLAPLWPPATPLL
jgi:aldehyde dehydrogenase (NAD+)